MGWLANVDVSPCTDQKAVLYYISKYCTMAETKTANLDDIMKELLPRVSSKSLMYSLIIKFMNKLIGERDISTQEACHLLLGLDLSNFSRTVVFLDSQAFRAASSQPARHEPWQHHSGRDVSGKILLPPRRDGRSDVIRGTNAVQLVLRQWVQTADSRKTSHAESLPPVSI